MAVSGFLFLRISNMARKKFSKEQIAQILVESVYLGERETADKYQIATITIQRWWRKVEIDTELFKLVEIKKRMFSRKWVDKAGAFIDQAFDYLNNASHSKNVTPEMVHAIAGALKIASEIVAIREVLDARLSGQDRENDTQD